jgi:hypothetical protein
LSFAGPFFRSGSNRVFTRTESAYRTSVTFSSEQASRATSPVIPSGAIASLATIQSPTRRVLRAIPHATRLSVSAERRWGVARAIELSIGVSVRWEFVKLAVQRPVANRFHEVWFYAKNTPTRLSLRLLYHARTRSTNQAGRTKTTVKCMQLACCERRITLRAGVHVRPSRCQTERE